MFKLAALLQILALSLLAIAGFLVGPALGCFVAGVSLLVVGVALERRQ